MKNTADDMAGRVLIALRAGAMDCSQLRVRLPACHAALKFLARSGLIECDLFVYRITDAGRAACPNRRDATLIPMYAKKPAVVIQERAAA